jgi:hypothetical protein
MDEMKILVLSPFLCGPQSGNGGGVLTYRQIAALAETNEVSFISFSGVLPTSVEDQCSEALKAVCSSVHTTPIQISRWQVGKAVLRSLTLKHPHLASICWLPSMRTMLEHQIQEFKPDVVWIQFPQMAQYVAVCGSVPCVMDVQDAYTLSGFRQAERIKGLGQLRSCLDWVCWTRYEAALYPTFAAVLTLSEQDANVLHAMSPLAKPVSIGLPLADSTANVHAPIPMRVGFAGAFGHRPNVEALEWFLSQVWPKVREQAPQATFVVAGRNAPESLLSLGDPSVGVAGFVPDIAEFYASNAVTVAPMVSGGGVKIKSVEAMLAGTALVSTSIGLEGIDAQDGQDAMVANTPKEFANAIVNLLKNSAMRERVAASARARATAQFSATAWSTRVNNILTHVVPTS